MTREEAIKIVQSATVWTDEERDALAMLIPELAESEDERTRKWLIEYFEFASKCWIHRDITPEQIFTYLERQKEKALIPDELVENYKRFCEQGGREVAAFINAVNWQKENPKSADSIPSDCTSDVRCEDRWHKVGDSLPDNGRLVLAKDCLGNVLLARYDGENWEVNVYDNEDHYCHNSISKWCEIPSEKQKEQKPLHWRRIEDATTQRTDDGCCVTSEKMLVKGWINDEDYRIVDENTMVNRDMLCIPVRELNAEQKEQKPEEKPINWTELTWEDINYLEDLMAKVHYEFRNGIGAESFGKEVLEKFREYKEDEYTDEKEQKPAESISQLTVQGKGVYKICPRCKERMVRDDSMVYTSMPPQYRYECPKCGESECDTVMYDNPEMEKQKPAEFTPNQFDGITYGMSGYSTDKPAEWSEEDEENLEKVIWYIEKGCKLIFQKPDKLISWLKSLRPQPKQEWSDEEKEILDSILSHYVLIDKPTDANGIPKEKYISLIKSIRFDTYKNCNSHWKPSEEQKEALEYVIRDYREDGCNATANYLQEVLDHLKNM